MPRRRRNCTFLRPSPLSTSGKLRVTGENGHALSPHWQRYFAELARTDGEPRSPVAQVNADRLRQQARAPVLRVRDLIDTNASHLLYRRLRPEVHGVHPDERADAPEQ